MEQLSECGVVHNAPNGRLGSQSVCVSVDIDLVVVSHTIHTLGWPYVGLCCEKLVQLLIKEHAITNESKARETISERAS
jgi:hypothetical protein